MSINSRFNVSVMIFGLVFVAGCGDKLPGMSAPKLPAFRTVPIVRSDIVRTVEATGTVQPRNTPNGVPVGAQVNGKIIKLFVDYNSTVTNGQVVALVDPLVYEAKYRNALGQLHSSKAKVLETTATLTLAEKTLVRKQALFRKQMCSEADYDAALASRDCARAALESAKASVEQAEASVSQTKADLDYCSIRSPVNGVVIARKVEEGETVVSSMNAVPVLTIAEDLKTVWIEATVPEADVGNIRVGQEVKFTADAYRKRFTGRVKQIRLAATTTSNVVTYPIIIEAENPDEMLFPGMTVTLSVETARAENVVVVSAAAFRFRPKPEDCAPGDVPRGRKLWFKGDDGKLSPVVVTEGVSDDSFTEIVHGAEYLGREAVIGYQISRPDAVGKPGGESNPFMPKPPKHGTAGTAPEPKK